MVTEIIDLYPVANKYKDKELTCRIYSGHKNMLYAFIAS